MDEETFIALCQLVLALAKSSKDPAVQELATQLLRKLEWD